MMNAIMNRVNGMEETVVRKQTIIIIIMVIGMNTAQIVPVLTRQQEGSWLIVHWFQNMVMVGAMMRTTLKVATSMVEIVVAPM